MEEDSINALDDATLKSLSGGAETLEGAVSEVMGRQLDRDPTGWSEVTHRVMRGVVEGLEKSPDRDFKLRLASETAVLAVAKRWGNVVMAGKATVEASRAAASAAGLDSVRAAEQASLGAAEGVMRVGPVAFPVLQRELTPLVENFDVLFKRSRNLPALVEERPMIVEPSPEVTHHESFDDASDHAAHGPVVEDYSRSPFNKREEGPGQGFMRQTPKPVAEAPKVSFWGSLVSKVKGWFSRKS